MAEEIQYNNLKGVLNRYIQELENNLKGQFLNIKDTGDLAKSVDVHIVRLGENWKVEINLLEYYKYINGGHKVRRGPGKQPPIEPIIKWIKEKRIIPLNKKGKAIPIRSLAFSIAKKIARKGMIGKAIKGNPIVPNELKKINSKYKDVKLHILS